MNIARRDLLCGGAAGTIARKDTPGVREWALAFLGSYASNDGLLAEAMKDAQPLVRRGALRGYASAGKGEVMKDALKDPSPMVRLAAIRFAGQLKCQDAVAGLFEQLRSVEDELSHNAARESLGQIGTEPVAKSAAAMADEMWKQAHEEDAAAGAAAGVANEGGEKIKQLQTQVQKAQEAAAACDKAYQALAIAKPAAAKADVEAAKAKLTEAQKRLAEAQTALQDPSSRAAAAQDTSAAHIRQKGKCFRNMRSCHWLLGQLKSPEGFDLRMELLRLAVAGKSADFVQTDSPFLEEVSASLGRLGDARAIDPLNQLMAGIGKHAPGLSMMTPPPGFRYNPHVTVATMIALGQLKAPQRLVDMKAILDVRIMMSGRLNFESEIIMRIMPDLVTEQNRPTIEAMVGGVIRPEGAYDLLVRFQAVKTAVKVGLQKQVPAIRDMLVKERQDRNSMRVAAWALKKLTGEDLPIGEPQVLQGDWILRKR